MAYGDYDGPNKPDKGKENGCCNRTRCQASPAPWYNHGSFAWYCDDCKRSIWSANSRTFHIDMPSVKHPMFETREMMDARLSGEPKEGDFWNRMALVESKGEAAVREAMSSDAVVTLEPIEIGKAIALRYHGASLTRPNLAVMIGEAVAHERQLASIPPACPCTNIEQDENCPIGYPSMLCGICEGKGVTTKEDIFAMATEMWSIAESVGEPEDTFAAWESIELIKSQVSQLSKSLAAIVNDLELRAKKGVVDCSAGVYIDAKALLASLNADDFPAPQSREDRRNTFVIPEGYEAVRDADGRATGEVRPKDKTEVWRDGLGRITTKPDHADSVDDGAP